MEPTESEKKLAEVLQIIPKNPDQKEQQIRRVESSSMSSVSKSPSGKSSQSLDHDHKDSHDDKNEDHPIRYKYCCKVCKHTDKEKDKKACVCVVPLNQRRTHLGDMGCQTCGCEGCSRQDFESRGEDPVYRPGDKKKTLESELFQARNGCCRKCMKAFSKSNKSCLCQVPLEVRKTKLPPTGCKVCGCFGCNPEDKKDERMKEQNSRSREKQKKKYKAEKYEKHDKYEKQDRQDKHDKYDKYQKYDKYEKRKPKRSSTPQSRDIIDTASMNFYNIDRSVIGTMIANDYQVLPSLVGFGVPQRAYSYIYGKPKKTH